MNGEMELDSVEKKRNGTVEEKRTLYVAELKGTKVRSMEIKAYDKDKLRERLGGDLTLGNKINVRITPCQNTSDDVSKDDEK